MNPIRRATFLGALLAVPIEALAQQSPRASDPADPGAVVTPVVYESVFARPSPEPQDTAPTPDKAWRAANAAVAGSPGHAGHAAHQAGNAGHPDQQAAPAAPAAPLPGPARQPAPADHSKHHH